uniref:Lipid binding protein n=2 Tax=Grifola frondosa TaxID=5627 RepID=A0A1D5B380_GRIFR|nr:Chain A, Lipid binding protein [Grifola frondosa]BAO31550.1 hypothetical protein [Grifola frondosa]
MLYGVEIDEQYLRVMEEYKDKEVITQADMAKVALQRKNVYQDQAEKRQAELKAEYGVGVCVLVRVYNATGGPITAKIEESFRGHFGAHTREKRIGNGQWTVFIHTKSAGAAVGSAGCIVYGTTDNLDIFSGWQNPWNRSWDSQVLVEVRQSGHWWKNGSKDYMLHLLDTHNGQNSDSSYGDVKAHGSTGNETTAYVEYVYSR